MNYQSIFQYISGNLVGSIIGGIIALYVGLAILTYLYKRFSFYSWYLLPIVAALIIALTTRGNYLVNWNLYCYAFLLGMTTAFAEIISKFRDEPLKAMGTPHALIYHLLNGAIAAFALKILILFGSSVANPMDQFKTVLAAGLGSMLIMRSKLFNIKVAGEDISFGPEQIIKIFFRYMEAAIDRLRAQYRIEFVKKNLGHINPEKVFSYSETMLLASQALEEAARKACSDGIKQLRIGDYKDEQPRLKSYRLGFLLLDNMGEDFVTKLFEDVPMDWQLEAPIQEKKEASLVDRLSPLPLFPSVDENEQLIPYFAYGTNLCSNVFRARLGTRWREMDETKFREVTTPKKCVLEGYRLVFSGIRTDSHEPGLEHVKMGLATVIKGEPNDKVEGVLYQLHNEVIKFLDMTEPGYYRTNVTVKVDDKPVPAQAYVAEVKRDGVPPERDYLQIILDGAGEFQLSPEYREQINRAASADEVVSVGV